MHELAAIFGMLNTANLIQFPQRLYKLGRDLTLLGGPETTKELRKYRDIRWHMAFYYCSFHFAMADIVNLDRIKNCLTPVWVT